MVHTPTAVQFVWELETQIKIAVQAMVTTITVPRTAS